jgi:2-polyprenyl-3-methyl-5-hydroxy-6-metoxy-1,4-benzoquinol methylase
MPEERFYMVFDAQREAYPLFWAAANHLESNCYFFKDVLAKLNRIGIDYPFAEELCRNCYHYSRKDKKTYLENVHSLIEFSVEFLRLQMHLHKTGGYLYKNFKEVEDNVYNNPNRKLSGPWYTWALYFSQIFWVTHWNVMKFFRSVYCKTDKETGEALEVPTGTGIFITLFLNYNPGWRGTGVDLSDSAIAFTKDVLSWYHIEPERMSLIKDNIYTWQTEKRFDRILCGEFLEHLEDPLGVLKKLHSLLKPDGKVFITVAVYASMIDHIYLYRSADEVRKHIREAGLVPTQELVQAVFEKRDPEGRDTPVNYCAILEKASA